MFDTHKLNEEGFKVVKEFKNKMSKVCSEAMEIMDDPRSKALFKTNVETAVFYGTRAIAENPDYHTEVVKYEEYKGN